MARSYISGGAETQRWELLDAQGRTLTFDDVVRGWREREDFRLFWCSSLRNAPFDAYAWECPPVTANTLSRGFDCVFVASPLLARMPADSQAFAEHFRPDQSVATFANLGGDAVLVAPSPADGGDNYSHLASFVATAPASQAGRPLESCWRGVQSADRDEACLDQHGRARRCLAARASRRPSEILSAHSIYERARGPCAPMRLRNPPLSDYCYLRRRLR
jgi:hypothetical protein